MIKVRDGRRVSKSFYTCDQRSKLQILENDQIESGTDTLDDCASARQQSQFEGLEFGIGIRFHTRLRRRKVKRMEDVLVPVQHEVESHHMILG